MQEQETITQMRLLIDDLMETCRSLKEQLREAERKLREVA
jgi:hypothetical protein